MIFGFNGNTRMKTLAGALVLGMFGLASAANAATNLVGGGATLPALGYGGDATHRLITPVSGSFLSVYSAHGNPQTSYCQTGSGTGKNILAGGVAVPVPSTGYDVQPNGLFDEQNRCIDGSLTPTGFGAASVGRTDLTQPNFAGADSPLTASDFSKYRSNRPTSYPVQFPAVAGAIAIAYNKASVASLDLSETQICQIFSGQITDWSQISSASGPIKVVYRTDGSGTTFGFSNHLSSVCGGTASQHFVTDQAFTNVVSKYFTTIPSTWNGQSGNQNVVNAVLANDGAIAYAEAANVATSAASLATIGGLNPLNDFGAVNININTNDVVYNQIINGADPTTGRPVLAPISGAPSTSCIALVKPDAYAKGGFAGNYPIAAVSYLLANSNNNGADTASVRSLIWAPYDSSITTDINLTSIGPFTGFSFLNTSFTQANVTGCIAN